MLDKIVGDLGVSPTTGLPNKLPGKELGRTDLTANYGSAGLATTEADVTGATVTVTCDGVNPVEVRFDALVNKLANNGLLLLYLYEGATKLATAASTLAATEYDSIAAVRRLTPSAGAHTYKVTMALSTVGANITASADSPAQLSVTQL